MKLHFFIFYFILSLFNSKAQTNLVPNPSFEYTIDCLLNGGDIIKAIPWFAPNTVSSSDYFNACYYNLLYNHFVHL